MIGRLKETSAGRALLIGIGKLLGVINTVIPKRERRILFYDSTSCRLSDNTEAFYSWLVEQGYAEHYELIRCTAYLPGLSGGTTGSLRDECASDDKEPRRIPDVSGSVGPAKGVLYYLTSKYVFYSFGDFRIAPSRNQIVVNQWHGTPLKKIVRMTGRNRYEHERTDNFTWVLTASSAFVDIMAQSFGCDRSRVQVLGQARTDYLWSDKEIWDRLDIRRDRFKKVIAWMPTFRSSTIDGGYQDGDPLPDQTGLPLMESLQDLEKLQDTLEQYDCLLIVKPHPYAVSPSVPLPNIVYLTNDDLYRAGIRLYELLGTIDALITDYSSAMCDFLLLDLPMCFTVNDIVNYEAQRGFNLDNISSYLPGPKVEKAIEVHKFIENVATDVDGYQEQRNRANKFFNDASCRSNCQALADFCGLTIP